MKRFYIMKKILVYVKLRIGTKIKNHSFEQ